MATKGSSANTTAAGIRRAFSVLVVVSLVATGVVLQHPAVLQTIDHDGEDVRNRPTATGRHYHGRDVYPGRRNRRMDSSTSVNDDDADADADKPSDGIDQYETKDDSNSNANVNVNVNIDENNPGIEEQDASRDPAQLPSGGKDDEEDPRPWLILHIGPPKSATTTIQHGLVIHGKKLAERDNFYYMGQFRFGGRTKDIERGPNRVFRLDEFESEDFLEAIRKHRDEGHNIIISAEQYTSQIFNWKRMFKRKFLHSRPKGMRIASTNGARNGTTGGLDNGDEPLFGFRVKIVVGYRHFFEWLPSMYYQTYHWIQRYYDPTSPEFHRPGIIEYTENFLDRLKQYDPDDKNTTIYTTADMGSGSQAGIQIGSAETSHGSLWAYLKWSSTPELFERVDILDLHQQTSKGAPSEETEGVPPKTDVFADFVCQSLPSATHTCSDLAGGHHEAIEMRSSDTKHFATIPDKNRINQHARQIPAYNQTFLYEGEGKIKVNQRMNTWFRKNRRRVGPLTVCISEASRDRLKRASWGFLRQMILLSRSHAASRKKTDDRYYRSLFRSSKPTDHLLLSSQVFFGDGEDYEDDSWMGPAKAAHDRSFDAFLEKGKLCQVNVEKLFENEDFVETVFRVRATLATPQHN